MDEFQWDEANTEHVALHGVSRDEAEEAYRDKNKRYSPIYGSAGEPRKGIVGKTEVGRFLFVVYTLRLGYIRVVTARDADRSEKKYYKGK